MFTTIIIFGEIATKFGTEGEFSKALEEIDCGGDVKEVSFKTQAELVAYHQGLADNDGWSEYYVVEGEEVNKLKLAAIVKGIKL